MSFFDNQDFKFVDDEKESSESDTALQYESEETCARKVPSSESNQVPLELEEFSMMATDMQLSSEILNKGDQQAASDDVTNPKERLINVKVMSVGGGGGNILDYMMEHRIDSVDYVCTNTDQQDLARSLADHKIQLGVNLTRGLGAGSKPDVGYAAAMESHEEIKSLLKGTDLLFIAAGMGGGTGTGASPVIAEVAKSLGILTVAVVTKPFDFEGKKRSTVACEAIEELKDVVDSLIIIPNQRLLSYLPNNISLPEAFNESNKVLYNAVSSIVSLLLNPGFINVDYADVQTVMSQKGLAIMGSGVASGDNRAIEATQAAVQNPLVEDFDFSNAQSLLVNVSASSDFGINEFNQVGEELTRITSSDANLIVGVSYDDALDDKVRVTIVATGCLEETTNAAKPEEKREEEDVSEGLKFSVHVDAVGAHEQVKKRVNSRYEDAFASSSEEDQKIPAYLRKQAD